MKKKYYALSLLYLIACNEVNRIKENKISGYKNNIEVIDLANSDVDKTIDITPFIDTLRFVKLELTDESIIGYIQKLIVYKEHIYILDTQTSSLFIFDIDGRFLSKIQSIGQGPGEYTQLDFFDIDYAREQILLTDLMGYQVLKYDLEGQFIERMKIPLWIEGLAPVFQKGYVVYANFRNNKRVMSPEYNLIYLDSLMKIERAYFPYDSYSVGKNSFNIPTPQSGVFYTYKENIVFFTLHNYFIYRINRDGLFPSYEIRFTNKVNNYNSLIEDALSDAKSFENGQFYSITSVQETDQLLSFTFTRPSSPLLYQTYFFKNSKRILCAFDYTVGGQLQFDIPTIASYDSWLISELSIEKLLTWKENVKENHDENSFLQKKKTVVEGLTLDDNPVLMFYKLKDL